MLALIPGKGRIVFATVDPWELRSIGEVNPGPGSHLMPLRRLIRRERPTVIVAAPGPLNEALRRAARVVGAPVLPDPPAPVSATWARALYPELPLFGPTRELEAAARLAIAAVLHSRTPSRTYARRRRTASHAS